MGEELTRREFVRHIGTMGMGALFGPVLLNAALAGEAEAAGLVAESISSAPLLKYDAHVADKGWLKTVGDGQIAGTVGESRRMEALRVYLKQSGQSAVRVSAHVADVGWMGAVSSGQVAGTVGKAKGLQACKISLQGELASRYDIYYSLHLPYRGWLGYARNGAPAGSTGMAVDAQAVRIKLVPKGQRFDAGSVPFLQKPALTCKGHSADLGWLSKVAEGKTVGTTGRAKQLEAFVINLLDFDGKSGIKAKGHVSNIGWMSAVGSGQTCGTTGRGLGLEAVKLEVDGSLKPFFSIAYRVHVRNVGWCGWAKDGAMAGSTGLALPIEAIEVRLLNKAEAKSFNYGGSAVVTRNPAARTAEQEVQGRIDAIANGSLRYNSGTVMRLGSRFTGTRANEQCKGFAKNVFYLLFRITPSSTQSKPNNYLLNGTGGMSRVGYYSNISAAQAQSLFGKARPGDFVQIRRRSTGNSHSAIVYSVSSRGITFFEANTDGKNTVMMNTYTWAQLASKNRGMSLYTASSYSLK